MNRSVLLSVAILVPLFASTACDFGAGSYEFVDERPVSGTGGSDGTGQGGSDAQGGSISEPDKTDNALDLPPEDCTNGVDDDGDGAVDSDDTECEECAPAVPDGWMGPAHVYVGPGNKEPACGFVLFTGGEEPVADDLICSECGCNKNGTASCTLPVTSFNVGPNSACSSPAWSGDVGTTCAENIGGSGYYKFGDYKVSGLSCSATGGEVVDRPEPAFKTVVLGCEAPSKQGTCGAHEIARPEAPAGYRAKLCIAQGNDVPECPEEYPERSFFAEDIDDSRSCSECSCGNNFDCAATLQAFNQIDCTGAMTSTFTEPSTGCYGTPAISPDKSLRLTNVNVSGSCQPSTTKMIGDISTTGAVTVCCR